MGMPNSNSSDQRSPKNDNNLSVNDNDNYNSFLQSLSQQQRELNQNAVDEAKNIDLLLQQYGGGPANVSSNNNNNRACVQCLQNGWKCQWIADLGKCAQCEARRWKCEPLGMNQTQLGNNYNSSVNVNSTSVNNSKNATPPMSMNAPQNIKREHSTSNESNTKRHKNNGRSNTGGVSVNNSNSGNNNNNNNDSVDSISNNHAMYSNFITSLYNSMSPQNTTLTNTGNNSNSTNMNFPINQSNNTSTINMNSGNGMNMNTPAPIQYPRSSFYVGPTSVYDMAIINNVSTDNMDQIQISKSSSLRKVSNNVQFLLRDDQDQSMYIRQEQEVDMVEKLIYPHGRILVDIFFKLIHPYFPILHERVFLEKYSRSYRELTAPLLASIYSLALQWWDFHPKLIGFNKPDSSVVKKLNDLAFTTFFHRIDRPKLSMIQTGLLILQCRTNQPDNWVICSNLVALAEELGLGVDCRDWKLPKWEKDLRKRLAWAVWAQDKWIALLEGRHSHLILGRNWMVKLLKRDDFPQSSPTIDLQNANGNNGDKNSNNGEQGKLDMDPTNPMFPSLMMMDSLALIDMNLTKEEFNNATLMFQQMVSLSIIIGEIMDTFYTQGAIHVNTSIEQVLKLAKPLQLKLREWYHSLPPQLSMGKFIPRKFNSNASLTLQYFAAEITLHRKIISTLCQNSKEAPKELVQVCRMAAKTRLIAAIEFVRDLKNEHVNAFWYSSATGNFMLIGTFAALLYVTSQGKEEATMFRDLMRNYIWILRVGSKSFDKLTIVLDNMHQLLAQVPGLLTDDAPVNEFVPPPLSVGVVHNNNGFRSGSSSTPVQQQLFKQNMSGMQQQQQHARSSNASPAITDQGSASPLVLQNSNNGQATFNNGNNINNGNNVNNGIINNNNSHNQNSNSKSRENMPTQEEVLQTVMINSPYAKSTNASTPGSAGKTPIYPSTSTLSTDLNNTTSMTPSDYKSLQQQQQYSPSLQSQISETYSVGQIANPSGTPRNDPISTNVPGIHTVASSANNTGGNNTATGTPNTNNSLTETMENNDSSNDTIKNDNKEESETGVDINNSPAVPEPVKPNSNNINT